MSDDEDMIQTEFQGETCNLQDELLVSNSCMKELLACLLNV